MVEIVESYLASIMLIGSLFTLILVLCQSIADQFFRLKKNSYQKESQLVPLRKHAETVALELEAERTRKQ